AGLAADAFGNIDQFGHFGLTLGWRRHGGRRPPYQVLLPEFRGSWLGGGVCDWRIHGSRPPYATGPRTGSISTRNALISGVCALASPTGGVSELIGAAFLVSPINPKFSGSPTECTTFPLIVSGLSRLVTTAFPLTEPRL